MHTQVRNFLIKPLLALAIAIPAMMAGNVADAEARHKHKRAAIIAGAIIGGAIIYKHHKRKKYHRRVNRNKYYGRKHYRSGHRSGYRYGHRNRYHYRHRGVNRRNGYYGYSGYEPDHN